MSDHASSVPLKKVDRTREAALRRIRREEAPRGYVTGQMVRNRLGLTEGEYKALVKRGTIASDGLNPYGYAVFSEVALDRWVAMKKDGSLFRASPPAPSDASTSTSLPPRSSTRMGLGATCAYSAEDGARVFELLKKDVPLPDIIIATKIHPHAVRAICMDYNEFTGSIQVSKEYVDKINAIRNLPGRTPRDSGAALLECLEMYSMERTCVSDDCTAPAVDKCHDCLTHEHRLARQREREAREAAIKAANDTHRTRPEGP